MPSCAELSTSWESAETQPGGRMGWAGGNVFAPSSGSGPAGGGTPVLAAQVLSPSPTSLLSCVLPAAQSRLDKLQ